MQQNPSQRHHVATGGKENPLKVWDLERPDKPIFTAKNVRQKKKTINFLAPSSWFLCFKLFLFSLIHQVAHDWLDMRVPVWVRDIGFIPDSDKIVTCTGHHQVCLYSGFIHVCMSTVISYKASILDSFVPFGINLL